SGNIRSWQELQRRPILTPIHHTMDSEPVSNNGGIAADLMGSNSERLPRNKVVRRCTSVCEQQRVRSTSSEKERGSLSDETYSQRGSTKPWTERLPITFDVPANSANRLDVAHTARLFN